MHWSNGEGGKDGDGGGKEKEERGHGPVSYVMLLEPTIGGPLHYQKEKEE